MNRSVLMFGISAGLAVLSSAAAAVLCPLLVLPAVFPAGFLVWKTVEAARLSSVIRGSRILDDRQLHHPLYRQVLLLIEKADHEEREEIESALVNTQAEMNALQNQINPHFLYNTLDTIRGQALIDDSPLVAEMAESLSVLFRYSISNTGQLVTLREELYCVEKYLSIQQIRFRGRFHTQKDADPEVMDCLIPRLTLEPIVENAIFHGLECTASGGTITISAHQNGEYLIIDIRDNGIGMDEETLNRITHKLQDDTLYTGTMTGNHGLGIALVNVNKRIRLVFGRAYGLAVSSVPDMGTDVSVVIPVLYRKEEMAEDENGSPSSDELHSERS